MAETRIQSYRELKVWQLSREIASDVYLITSGFPGEEKFGITSQLRRAVVSIASNIAEGHGRRLPKAFKNHLSIARGSAWEVETQLIISADLEFITPEQIQPLLSKLDEISRMMTGLQRSLDRKINQG